MITVSRKSDLTEALMILGAISFALGFAICWMIKSEIFQYFFFLMHGCVICLISYYMLVIHRAHFYAIGGMLMLTFLTSIFRAGRIFEDLVSVFYLVGHAGLFFLGALLLVRGVQTNDVKSRSALCVTGILLLLQSTVLILPIGYQYFGVYASYPVAVIALLLKFRDESLPLEAEKIMSLCLVISLNNVIWHSLQLMAN
jgi:hypothetical protein